jgi:hypothetical protein
VQGVRQAAERFDPLGHLGYPAERLDHQARYFQ